VSVTVLMACQLAVRLEFGLGGSEEGLRLQVSSPADDVGAASDFQLEMIDAMDGYR
jgi:hypothetical protein